MNWKELELYEHFVKAQGGDFMQSVNWTRVKQKWQYERILLKNPAGEPFGAAQLFIKELPALRTAFVYVPRGPVCDYSNPAQVAAMCREIIAVAKRYRAFLVKIDPPVLGEDKAQLTPFFDYGFVAGQNNWSYETVQCRSNYVLDLEGKTLKNLREGYTAKCRYNVGVAERKGVVCKVGTVEDVPVFHQLMVQTGKRDQFQIRSADYFVRMLHALGDACRLYLCYLEDTPLSGAIAVQYGGRTSYVYGASSNVHRNYMPNYLMQDQMIRWAIEGGCSLYDFQGVPHYYDPTHPNYGVYRFKQGFQGRVIDYFGELDLVLRPGIKRLIDTVNYAKCRKPL